MKNKFLLILLLLILIEISPIYAQVSSLENQVIQTTNNIERTRKSGAYVSDLVDQINNVIKIAEKCNWDQCNETIKTKLGNELTAINQIALNRYKPNYDYLLLIIPIFIIILYLLFSKNLIHKIRWVILKKQRIIYRDDKK